MRVKAFLVAMFAASTMVLHCASNWWERAYATYSWSETSPDGCLRIDTYNAFWVTPSALHRMPHPDPESHVDMGTPWEAAIFKRAYEESSGEFLGETIIFDPSVAENYMDWGGTTKPGRRIVKANGFPLVDSSRCSDTETLARLEAAYERERESNRPIVEAWENARTDHMHEDVY